MSVVVAFVFSQSRLLQPHSPECKLCTALRSPARSTNHHQMGRLSSIVTKLEFPFWNPGRLLVYSKLPLLKPFFHRLHSRATPSVRAAAGPASLGNPDASQHG